MSSKRVRRRQNNKRGGLWILGIVVVAIVAVAAIAIYGNSQSAAQVSSRAPAAPLDKCGQATCGSASAPVTIDVYADFQCPYCKQFDPVLEQLGPTYVDTGKVKLVYHNFPIIGPDSFTAAQGVECAGDQNKFWMFLNDLFAHQGAENSGVFTAANVKRMAAGAGLDANTFNACLDSGKYVSLVEQQLAQGRALGVQATPTFFVNGKIHEGGASYDQVVALINAAQPK